MTDMKPSTRYNDDDITKGLPIKIISREEWETEQRSPRKRYGLRIDAVAAKLGTCEKTVRRWAEKGALPAPRMAPYGGLLWLEDEVDAAILNWPVHTPGETGPYPGKLPIAGQGAA